MIRPNYKDYRLTTLAIQHSAKGSVWENHKYIKRVDGTYYYPDSYEGGRHLSDAEKKKKEEDETSYEDYKSIENKIFKEMKKFSKDDAGQKVRGDFGTILWEKFGINYQDLTEDEKKEIDQVQRDLADRIGKRKDIKTKVSKASDSKIKLSAKDVDNLAKEVKAGKFGDVDSQIELLGENYERVKKRLDKISTSSVGSKKVKTKRSK